MKHSRVDHGHHEGMKNFIWGNPNQRPSCLHGEGVSPFDSSWVRGDCRAEVPVAARHADMKHNRVDHVHHEGMKTFIWGIPINCLHVFMVGGLLPSGLHGEGVSQ
jgi:hypothetical protein